jgi:hypothetical protein
MALSGSRRPIEHPMCLLTGVLPLHLDQPAVRVISQLSLISTERSTAELSRMAPWPMAQMAPADAQAGYGRQYFAFCSVCPFGAGQDERVRTSRFLQIPANSGCCNRTALHFWTRELIIGGKDIVAFFCVYMKMSPSSSYVACQSELPCADMPAGRPPQINSQKPAGSNPGTVPQSFSTSQCEGRPQHVGRAGTSRHLQPACQQAHSGCSTKEHADVHI